MKPLSKQTKIGYAENTILPYSTVKNARSSNCGKFRLKCRRNGILALIQSHRVVLADDDDDDLTVVVADCLTTLTQ